MGRKGGEERGGKGGERRRRIIGGEGPEVKDKEESELRLKRQR